MASAVTRPESSASGRIFRFGAFEFCVETRELRKHGLRIKLSGQPASVLAMLVERPGEVITREELRKRLWPDGTYVDFEHSVNTAVKRLRQALGDSADAPRFIETLARNGYRFIAPVSGAKEPLPSVAALSRRPVLPAKVAGVAILVVLVGVLAGLHEKRRTPIVAGPIRSLAVLPLANLSG